MTHGCFGNGIRQGEHIVEPGEWLYVCSAKTGEKKEICNSEVIGEIEAEIRRLGLPE